MSPFPRIRGIALALLVASILATTAGVAQGAPAHAATKTQTVVLRGSATARGTFDVVVGVRSRIWRAVRVKVYVTGKRPHTLWASASWGDQTRFRVTLTGKRVTVRAVSETSGVDVRARLLRVGAAPAAPAAQSPAAVAPSTPAPASPTTPTVPASTPPTPPPGPYQTLDWQDNFAQDYVSDGSTPGNLPNSNTWSLDYAGGCGTNTLSTDVTTASPTASNYVDLTPSGLAINAIETSPGSWTSAQIDTAGNASFGPGSTIEARIYMPTGQGLCPAFWMVSDNTTNPGEIDVVEAPTFVGEQSPLAAYFTLHGPGPVSQQWEQSESSVNLAGWHTYSVTWSADAIIWSVDGTPYATADAAALIPGASWSTYSDSNYHIIFDLAVGGWPCADNSAGPDCAPPSSATMFVQWVRVWT